MSKSKEPKVGELVAKALAAGIADEAIARTLIKKNNVRSFKRLDEIVIKFVSKGTKATGPKYRTTKTIPDADKRGYRFTSKWIASLKALDGIAVHPYFLKKLKAHAAEVGAEVTSEMTQIEIAKAVAARV